MLDGGGDEGDCEAGHYACEGVAEGGEFAGCGFGGIFYGMEGGGGGFEEAGGGEDVFLEEAAIVG